MSSFYLNTSAQKLIWCDFNRYFLCYYFLWYRKRCDTAWTEMYFVIFVRIFFQSLLILAYHDFSINCVYMSAVILTTNALQKNMILLLRLPDATNILCWFTDRTCRDSSTCKNGRVYMILMNFWNMLLMLICNSFHQKGLRLFETELNLS